MATIKVILNKNWKDKSDRYPIVFQILHHRKKKLLYTGWKVIESDFDVKQQKVILSDQSALSGRTAKKINQIINKKRKLLLSKIAKYEDQGVEYSVNEINDILDKQYNVWFLEYMGEQITEKENTDHDGTADAYKSTRNSFRRFLKGKDVKVSEITPKLIRQYTDFLTGDNVSSNTVGYYMRNLKTIYNRIISDGFNPVCVFPFKSTKVTITKTPKRAISKDMLRRIYQLEFSTNERHIELARDIFMFSFYLRGTAFVDVVGLKKNNIIGDTIVFSRQKSKQPIRIAIFPQLGELMKKYTNDTEYVFPILDVTALPSLYTQYKLALKRINYGLKIIGRRIGLNYPMTTYVARHTWATLVKELGVPISVISEGLGHRSEEMTRIYLKEFDTGILDGVNQEAANFR